PKAGVDGHDQHHVGEVEHVLHHVDGRVGVEGHTRLGAEVTDGGQGPVQVGARLGVDDDQVAPGLDVAVHQFLGLEDHQVRLEHHRAVLAARGDDVRPHGEVRYEPPVHDVPLDPVHSCFLERGDLLTQPGEVGREDGGDDLEASWLAHGGPFGRVGTSDAV